MPKIGGKSKKGAHLRINKKQTNNEQAKNLEFGKAKTQTAKLKRQAQLIDVRKKRKADENIAG
jgi:hypothetical protein